MNKEGLSLSELAKIALQQSMNQDSQDSQDSQELNTASVGGVNISTYEDIQNMVSSVSWAWKGWMANGFLTMLAAEPGKGKSYLALWISKIYIYGGTFPDGALHEIEVGGKILWCESEYAQALTMERAKCIGLSLSDIITPLGNTLDPINLRNPEHRDLLRKFGELPEVKIIVIDSLSGAHNAKENDSTEMKEICQWLADFAQETNKPIICIHHFNKLNFGNDIPSLSKIRGSSSISQFFRCILGIDCVDISQPNRRRLSCIKSNLAALPNPLGFEIVDGGHEIIFMDAPDAPKKQNQLDRAVLWLTDYLKTEVEQSIILAAAEIEQISKKTLDRAKNVLGTQCRIIYNSDTKQRKWFWRPKEVDLQKDSSIEIGGVGNVTKENNDDSEPLQRYEEWKDDPPTPNYPNGEIL